MKNKDLIAELQKLNPELEVHGQCSSSDGAYEIGYPREHITDNERAGPLCVLPNGTKVILVSLQG